MTIRDIINSGLDRAEVVEYIHTVDDDHMNHFKVTVRDLTNNKKWLMTWDLSVAATEDMTDHDLACMFIAHANIDLEDFRNGEE